MEERNESVDDVMLPGFRFHPTDEELVGFYLKRKIQQRPLSIELIRQLDIYKYDPWDLPKLATTGEKEWYFYCPRDRKYRNSARPNRVTGAGFWKATGTDRPIYSGNGTKCIGLKKSLVFYKGRAAKGLKTDWMMHEFRLPDSSTLPKPVMGTNIPPNDSWAICRIFKKTSITATQRAVSSLPTTSTSTSIPPKDNAILYKTHILGTDETGLVLSSQTNPDVPLSTHLPCSFGNSYDPFDYFEGKLPHLSIPNEPFSPPSFTFAPMEESDIAKSALDVSSILLNMSSSVLGDFGWSQATENSDPSQSSHGQPNIFSPTLLHQMEGYDQENALLEYPKQWETMSSIGYPLSCIWDKLFN